MTARTVERELTTVKNGCPECGADLHVTTDKYGVWLAPMAGMPGETVYGWREFVECVTCGYQDADDPGI